METRKCSDCKASKLTSEFYFDKANNNLKSICKICQRVRSRTRIKRERAIRGSFDWSYTKLMKVRKRALKLEIPCTLTTGDISRLYAHEICSYCGLRNNGWISMDRIEPSLGYTLTNITMACYSCNRIRGNEFTAEEMKLLGEALAHIYSMR